MPEFWTTSATGTAGEPDSTWSFWSATTSTTATIVWSDWNNGIPADNTPAWTWEVVVPQRPEPAPTPEAELRAAQLLADHLDDEQRESLHRDGCIYLTSSSGKRYRIRRGRSQNVQLVDETGHVLRTYCAHPVERVPDPDTMLAQKLMLETDEDSFLAIANAS